MALKPDPNRWPDGEKNENYKADLKNSQEHPERWGGDQLSHLKTVVVPSRASKAKASEKDDELHAPCGSSQQTGLGLKALHSGYNLPGHGVLT